jgi:hypothetical protein
MQNKLVENLAGKIVLTLLNSGLRPGEALMALSIATTVLEDMADTNTKKTAAATAVN